jgi:hypothetical protein
LCRRAGHCGARPEVGRKSKKQTCPLDPFFLSASPMGSHANGPPQEGECADNSSCAALVVLSRYCRPRSPSPPCAPRCRT